MTKDKLNSDLEIEIINLLKAIEKLEIYQKNFADPDTFFAANYQKNFNDKVNLMIQINDELKKLNDNIKKKRES